jgi:hypothetical protein
MARSHIRTLAHRVLGPDQYSKDVLKQVGIANSIR